MGSLVRLSNVSKSFDGIEAVRSLDLEIGQGELFCLLGPSGCGKTTLLRILAGFEAPDSGTVEIDGADMDGVDPADRPVNIMFQNYALFPHYTVERNIGYGLLRAGVRGAELDARVGELLKLARLEGMGGRKPHQLSGGQRQRVALARALARRPKLLLLDEPLAALDRKLREDTQFELVDIQERLGTTFLVVTHDQEEAMALADRIGVMDRGRLLQVGAPKAIYERPSSRFVADFLGSVSFLEVRVAGRRGDRMDLDAAGPRITAADDPSLKAGDAATLAVRPEKISLGRRRPARGNVLPVTVEDMAFTGVATYYRVRTGHGQVLRIHQQNVAGGSPLTWNEEGYASFAPSSCIVLKE